MPTNKRVMEIVLDGKHLKKYDIYYLYPDATPPFHKIAAGTLIGESPEKLCEQSGWQRDRYEFIQTSFSFWDYNK